MARSLADEPIVRLILDGTVGRVRLDKKATSLSLLVALGVRQDGQKILLAVKNLGGSSPGEMVDILHQAVRGDFVCPRPLWVRRKFNRRDRSMTVSVLGVDLGKNVCSLVGLMN